MNCRTILYSYVVLKVYALLLRRGYIYETSTNFLPLFRLLYVYHIIYKDTIYIFIDYTSNAINIYYI